VNGGLHAFLYLGCSNSEKQSRSTRPGAQALGMLQHAFCSQLKTCFRQKFRPKYA